MQSSVPQVNTQYNGVKDTLGSATLSFAERLSFSQRLRMQTCLVTHGGPCSVNNFIRIT